jgi:phosphate transport system permease protein
MKLFLRICTYGVVAFLLAAIASVAVRGLHFLNGSLLVNPPSWIAPEAGLYSALWGSVWVVSTTLVIAVPMGVLTAISLEEFIGPDSRIGRTLNFWILNLSGVPSIVYGILGLTLFVRGFDMGRTIIAAALTLALMVWPSVCVATQESLKAVSQDLRDASLALGISRVRTTFQIVLPEALEGILTSTLLIIARILGESAPLILIGAMTYVRSAPTHFSDAYTVLPLQIYSWISRPQEAFQQKAASGIVVMLTFLALFQIAALVLRYRSQRRRGLI